MSLGGIASASVNLISYPIMWNKILIPEDLGGHVLLLLGFCTLSLLPLKRERCLKVYLFLQSWLEVNA